MFAELNVLMDTIDLDTELKVVVFESANPDYFVAHYDLERGEVIPDQPGQPSSARGRNSSPDWRSRA